LLIFVGIDPMNFDLNDLILKIDALPTLQLSLQTEAMRYTKPNSLLILVDYENVTFSADQ